MLIRCRKPLKIGPTNLENLGMDTDQKRPRILCQTAELTRLMVYDLVCRSKSNSIGSSGIPFSFITFHTCIRMLSLPVLGALAVVVVVWVAGRIHLNKSTSVGASRPPPGPKGLPIVGNLPEIPPYHSWLKFYEWSKIYGPIFKLSIFGSPHIVVSTEKVANDLMRERGTLYSSREQLPMAAVLMSGNLRPLFLPYADLWRKGRKLMHHLTMSSVATGYEPIQEEESLRLLHDLIREPSEYERWFERYSAGLIMRLAFGQMVYTGEEDSVRRILAVVHTVERVASPGAYLVDTLPSLMYLPAFLAPFKREGARLHAEELALFRSLQSDVKTRLDAGDATAEETFTAKFITNQQEYDLSPDAGAYVVGTLFEAGAGTTAAAMMSFLLAMTLHPKSFLKLQEELNREVGDSRLPSFHDMPNLPYVRACVKETLRWRPVTAGGVPHMLVKDDVYEGLFLRAGTNVHANQWAIHREEALYPQPEEFKPERWLEQGWPTYREPLSTYPNLQNFSAFGFGRRICPGQNIAERSLNILVARIGWGCEIKRKRDAAGKEVDVPLYDYTSGFNVQPKKFEFDLSARKDREVFLEKEWERAWEKRGLAQD